MSENQIRTELAKVTQIVQSWPQWKQHILVNSSKPTNSSSRLPVGSQQQAVAADVNGLSK